MSTLGDKLRCPHCLEEIDNLENPKQLPCNHIYCSPCLETLTETVQTGVIITCSICSTEHHPHDLSALQPPEGCSTELQLAEESATPCDRCKEKKKTAVCYCVNCESKLCTLHEEVCECPEYKFGSAIFKLSNSKENLTFGTSPITKETLLLLNDEIVLLFVFRDIKTTSSDEEKKHKLISIQLFEKTPTLYKKATCEEHGFCYGVCCKNCYCLKCPECENETRCACKERAQLNRLSIYYPKEHQFSTLKSIAVLVKEEFDILMRKCSERITEMCKLEKETWQRLDELEEECKKLRDQVERKTGELINAIKTEAARQIGHISRFESKKSKEIEEYLSEMREKRENYERDSAACADFIRDNHVVEIVKQRDERKQCISVEPSGQLAHRVWSTKCIKDIVNGFIDFNLNIIPQGIKLISSHVTDGKCYTTCFSDDGKLFAGARNGVTRYSECYDDATPTEIKAMVTSIDRAEGDMQYIFIEHSDYVRIVRATTNFVTSTELFQYDCPGELGRFAAVGSNYIAATCDSSSLVLFNKKTKKKYTRALEYNPEQLRFLSDDDSLLVAGGKAIQCYKITEDAILELMWTCDGLENVHSLCITSKGMVVASTRETNDGKLYLVSIDGKLLKTLIHEEFATSIYGQISIYDDVLAVPFWEKNCFKLFRLL